ncbi:helix-turn-helix domain-containing protein [Vibrio sp. JC009]|uniref:phage repressor protein CI n=1 Tax=Vibrio sp. JC009 TaxID=2912314 RepID=UPI0023B1A928|nr:phage repressor protein CI [Vibrio sp. JC009]WED23484.1 helix-turn-helix domain-containing protein [Vibrio sp. JC009]
MEKTPPFDYLKGEEFTERLKELTGMKTFLEMSDTFGIPKATFSAWRLHDRTSHELMVRLHLAHGIPIEEMALSKEDRAKVFISHSSKDKDAVVALEQASKEQSCRVQSFKLDNGKLVSKEALVFDLTLLNDQGVRSPMAITTEDFTAIIDKEINQAVSGTYLIDMDGLLSLNEIQRLPGKQLAIAFNNSTLTVDELSVKVVGKVVLDINKK